MPSEPAPWVCGYEPLGEISDTCIQHGKNRGLMWRVSGVKLFLDFHYSGGIFDFSGPKHITCTIKVRAGSGWHSKGSNVQYSEFGRLPVRYQDDNPGEISDVIKYVDRYRYGIKFEIGLSGDLRWIDYFSVNLCFIQMCVYLNLVPMIALLVAKYCMKNSDIYSQHISNEGRASIRLQLKDRSAKESLIHTIKNKLNSPTRTKKLDKEAWVELAKIEGFTDQPEVLWPFQENEVDIHEIIKETEKNPNSPFALTVEELKKKKNEIGEKIIISCPNYPILEGVYFCVSENPTTYQNGQCLCSQDYFRKYWTITHDNFNARSEKFLGEHFWLTNQQKQLSIHIGPYFASQKTTEDMCCDLFHLFDTNHNQAITKSEFVKILHTWGVNCTESVIEYMWQKLDEEKHNAVSLDKWIHFMKPYMEHCNVSNGIGNVFKFVVREIDQELTRKEYENRHGPLIEKMSSKPEDIYVETRSKPEEIYVSENSHSIEIPVYCPPTSHSMASQVKKNILVKNGYLGVGVNQVTGVIEFTRKDCQEIMKPFKGWRIVSINERPYANELLDQMIDSKFSYNLSLIQDKIENHTQNEIQPTFPSSDNIANIEAMNSEKMELPAGWRSAFSSELNKIYYINDELKKTQWNFPN